MNFWKKMIRVWFTLASLTSFFVGWSVLAHAPKPNQFNPADLPPLPQLEPIPSLDQLMVSQQSFDFVRPSRRAYLLRSGGS